MNERQNCGTCKYNVLFADEWGCDNEWSEAYGAKTAWDDWCEGWEAAEAAGKEE